MGADQRMTDLTGRTLGRYRLESLLGRGGMAEVWRATDTRLARTVAVKVIHATYAQDPHFAERFLREARVVASLEHPNILPVYDFGDEGGIPFLVMPHLAGGTLRDRLHGARAPLPVAASWIRQLADALDAAHAAGVLHRDVKPANVLLGKDDRLFLADFGIAKMVETMTGLTATGVVVGTPVYMAPEQAQGQPASPATDRYALAVVAYEVLAGRPPFDGDNPLSLMHQHVSTPAPALSSKVGGLPAGLDDVFRRALSKEPAERPPSCRALADAVSAFLPTSELPAVGPAAWGTPGSSMTAPTVLQPRTPTPPAGTPGTTPWAPPAPTPTPRPARPATPPPVRVATPPPSLTSDATVLTPGRRKRRSLAWGVGITAVALVGLGIAGKAKRDQARRDQERDSSKVNAAAGAVPAPTAVGAAAPSAPSSSAPPRPGGSTAPNTLAESPSSSSPSSASRSVDAENAAKILAADQKRIAELEKLVKNAEAAAQAARVGAAAVPVPPPASASGVPQAPAAPGGQDDETVAGSAKAELAAARERLDWAKKADHRISRDDFAFALETAHRVSASHPKNADARSLAAYAEGGLAYVAGNDAAASAMAVEAVMTLRRAGRPDHRALAHLVTRPDGTIVAPTGWELAVAYGDARGEAMGLLDAAVAENPRDFRAKRTRALLRHVYGLAPDGPEPRLPGAKRR